MRPSELPAVYPLSKVRPVLLLGPPGIGKTQSVVEYACRRAMEEGRVLVDLSGDTRFLSEEICPRDRVIVVGSDPESLIRVYDEVLRDPGRYYIYLRLVGTQVTPEDLSFPRIYKGSVVNMFPIKLAMLAIPGVRGVLFLDEITAIQRPDVKTMLFSLINEKTLGLGGGLSSDIEIIAAGNTTKDNPLAEPLPAPLANRFLIVDVEPPTVREFAEWYAANCGGCDGSIIGFLLAFPQYLFRLPKEPYTFQNFPTPRAWTALGRILGENPEIARDRELLETLATGLVGPEAGQVFAAWRYQKVPRVDEVIANPEILRSLDRDARMLALYAVATRVAELLVEGKTGEATDVISRVMEPLVEFDREAAVYMLQAAIVEARRRGTSILPVLRALLRDKQKAKIVGAVTRYVMATG